LPPAAPRMASSRVEADARVRPDTSSMIWAKVCRADRVTTRRGRAALPETFFLTRR